MLITTDSDKQSARNVRERIQPMSGNNREQIKLAPHASLIPDKPQSPGNLSYNTTTAARPTSSTMAINRSKELLVANGEKPRQ